MRECHETPADSVRILLTRVGGDKGTHALGDHARALARDAAAAALGQPAARIGLRPEPHGRPLLELAGRLVTGWHVALSHARDGAGGVAATALSRLGPVGLDVELLRDLPALALARRWFADAETAWLARLPLHRQTAAFLLLWTQKEAVGKALGIGLRGNGLRRRVPLPLDETGCDRGARRLAAMGTEPPMSLVAWVDRDLVVAVACAAESATHAPVTVVEVSANQVWAEDGDR